MSDTPVFSTSAEVRSHLVNLLRRDLIGPLPTAALSSDADLQEERLSDSPSRWYLAGYIAPADETKDDVEAIDADEGLLDDAAEDEEGAGGAAGDVEPSDVPAAKPRRLPSSLGITILLPPNVRSLEATVTWGDYVTVPRLEPEELLEQTGEKGEAINQKQRRPVDWERKPKSRTLKIDVPDSDGRSPTPIIIPESAAEQRPGGALVIETHARLFSVRLPDGSTEKVRAFSVFLVNRREGASIYRRYRDLSFAFQARVELACAEGFRRREDLSGYHSNDFDLRTADLHYCDVASYAVGRNVAAGWAPDSDGIVRRVWTEPLPLGEVERVVPNESAELKSAVTFGMEALAERAARSGEAIFEALQALPELYAAWIDHQKAGKGSFAPRREKVAETLIGAQETACRRIQEGIDLLRDDQRARLAFQIMNLAIARAQRRREAGKDGDPASQKTPTWRPFQLAFVLLNIQAMVNKTDPDRETVDLLFFPTGGGKTEAYLGLAAFTIAHRRLCGPGLLGAGVAVIMRYTLRLLTLDQLGRAAAVMCALELMRTGTEFLEGKRQLLGDWPIEIGLWVGSDASPNVLGGKGNTGDHTAVTRVRRFKKSGKGAPAPIKICPWCQTPFDRTSFSCTPNDQAPTNLEIRCANVACDFTRDRPLPVLTVDEPIYRRLPAFLIATIDKFAALPWEARSGAFFGHVNRVGPAGFYGPDEPGVGVELSNGWTLDPPDLIVQDELHLISGPLGTVAGLYETAIDELCTRTVSGLRVRPKIVASTATVRRASTQIEALFDRKTTHIFPAPGISRTDSFFALTKPASEEPARWYIGLAAQGRGPKLVFMRALRTLMSGAAAAFGAAAKSGDNPADPYMSAVCYFNALRELGGARRIVEEEVRAGLKTYGEARRRGFPADEPFADRNIKLPLELTSRVSTDQVAEAKERLSKCFPDTDAVDVAMATNMISVGLDITRLGLMVVQGQPKTAAEYIQATSRVGRNPAKPGLVITILNLHKPRDLAHYEDFGTFHKIFYRAVEATSVTPWAARALDRALAAIIVAIARHRDASATQERAAADIVQSKPAMDKVVEVILRRAPTDRIPGGREALESQIRDLIRAWAETAAVQSAGGERFVYARAASAQRLLHAPLEPGLENLSADHQRFQAGRSMRDVEAAVRLKVKSPDWYEIRHAEDV